MDNYIKWDISDSNYHYSSKLTRASDDKEGKMPSRFDELIKLLFLYFGSCL